MPGFGAAAQTAGVSVAEMADAVAREIRDAAPRRWVLGGHSMGAKVAAVLARRAEDGEAGLGGLAGLVLLAGSSPGSEPMDEGQRQAMLGWFAGDPDTSQAEVEQYIDQNIGGALDPATREQWPTCRAPTVPPGEPGWSAAPARIGRSGSACCARRRWRSPARLMRRLARRRSVA